jgi:hypothetical protein
VTAPKPTAKPQPNRTCRACKRPVIGARTEARSKWIALDPEPDPKGNQAAFQDSDGTWKTRQLGKGERPWDWETVLMPPCGHLQAAGSRGGADQDPPAERDTDNRRPQSAERQPNSKENPVSNSNSSSASSGGVGFTGLLTIAFIVLKLIHKIAWSWWWVLSPLWIGAALGIFVLLVILAVVVITAPAKR